MVIHRDYFPKVKPEAVFKEKLYNFGVQKCEEGNLSAFITNTFFGQE